ncbi:MAG: hypothetical protein O8C66_01555 [Candidatus Methanoperedens sp.]|nr:hypothetical protein [Candidatus Methanoperedens sp.]MCZ7369172.1 hypothetical protein [Candidatus Methanoperedens sp.]
MKFLDNLYLERESRKRLIELILIVGSILIALKTPETLNGNIIHLKDNNITTLFMIVIFFSVLYFILIQKEVNENQNKIVSVIGFVIAIFFSAIMASFLAISVAKDFLTASSAATSYLFVFFPYWLIFTFVIWVALREK